MIYYGIWITREEGRGDWMRLHDGMIFYTPSLGHARAQAECSQHPNVEVLAFDEPKPESSPAYPRCATCKHWAVFSPMPQGITWGECRRLQNAPGDIVTLKFVTHEPHSPPCLIAQSDFGCVLHETKT